MIENEVDKPKVGPNCRQDQDGVPDCRANWSDGGVGAGLVSDALKACRGVAVNVNGFGRGFYVFPFWIQSFSFSFLLRGLFVEAPKETNVHGPE